MKDSTLKRKEMKIHMNNGKLIIVSGPSGSGKDTVLSEVFKLHPEIRLSISSITRAMREGEVQDGKYHFISKEEFEAAIENNDMLEYNVYLGNYYGTPKKPVEDAIKDDAEIILEVDVNGFRSVKKQFPDAISIFIMPPSFKALETRLSGRGTESRDQIDGRLKIALNEINYANEYDYIVVNDDLKDAVNDVISVIVSSRSLKERKINTIYEVLNDAKSRNW